MVVKFQQYIIRDRSDFCTKMSTNYSKALSENNLCLTFQNILRHYQIIHVDDAMNGKCLHKMDFISHIQSMITQCKTQPGYGVKLETVPYKYKLYILKCVFVVIG